MQLPANVLPPSLGDDVTSLVQRAKLQELIPSSDVTFTDDQVVALMDQELRSYVVPLVENCRQEHFVVTRDYVLPPVTGTVNVENYVEIPDEATGLSLRDVYVTDGQGNFANIPRLSPEQVASRSTTVWWGTTNANTTFGTGGFYLQGNRLYLFPYTLANNRPIRLTFNRKPARLTKTANAAQIIHIDNDTVTLGSTLSQWSTGQYVDFIQNKLPHDYVTDVHASQSLYSSAIPLTAVPIGSASGMSLTFEDGITDSLRVGDWVVSHGYSPFAQLIPLEATNVLVQAVATRMLEALGDREGQAAAQKKLEKMAHDTVTMISPRVQGKTQKVSIPSRLSSSSSLSWRSW
jgi:hypothetical protein